MDTKGAGVEVGGLGLLLLLPRAEGPVRYLDLVRSALIASPTRRLCFSFERARRRLRIMTASIHAPYATMSRVFSSSQSLASSLFILAVRWARMVSSGTWYVVPTRRELEDPILFCQSSNGVVPWVDDRISFCKVYSQPSLRSLI